MRAAKASTKVNYGMALQQGLREDMEDYAVVVPGNLDRGEYLFAGVFDGHGGGKGADYLSKNLAKALAPAVNKAKKKGTGKIDETVVDAFTAFDDKLMDYLEKLPGEDWACGSTATTAMVWSDKLAIANVGDSRAVMSRGGKAVDLSSEHRPYGKSSISSREMARIKDAGGWIHDGRVCGILAVSRAFGDLEFKRGLEKMLVDGVLDGRWTKQFAKSVVFKEPPVTAAPDVLEMSIEPTDEFLIVASDGLWEVTTSSQSVIFVKRHLAKVGSDKAGLQSAAEALVEDAVTRRRTSDNVSVVIIGLPALDKAPSTPAAKGTVRGMVTQGGTVKPKSAKRGGLLGRLLG